MEQDFGMMAGGSPEHSEGKSIEGSKCVSLLLAEVIRVLDVVIAISLCVVVFVDGGTGASPLEHWFDKFFAAEVDRDLLSKWSHVCCFGFLVIKVFFEFAASLESSFGGTTRSRWGQ
ncbi:hypothetical protein V6N13_122065 [Hibiscus sabdariffa]